MRAEVAPLRGAEDVAGPVVLPLGVVSEVVSELTICVSMIGTERVEVVAGTVVLPLDEPTVRLLSCRPCRLSPEVVTLARLPLMLPAVVRNWKVWPGVGWKPP